MAQRSVYELVYDAGLGRKLAYYLSQRYSTNLQLYQFLNQKEGWDALIESTPGLAEGKAQLLYYELRNEGFTFKYHPDD